MSARVLDRIDGGNDALSIVALGCSLASVLPLVSAQKVANLAAGRERPAAGSFTLTDGIFAALGLVLWGMILAGFAFRPPIEIE